MHSTWDREDLPLQVEPVVVNRRFAVAGWVQGTLGGRALLERRNEGWQVVVCAGDLLRSHDGLLSMSVPEPQAGLLAAAVQKAEARIPEARLKMMAAFKGLVKMPPGGHAPTAASGSVEVRNAWSRATPPGADEAVVYLRLANSGLPDRLTAVRSDISEGAGLHENRTQDGMTGMRAVPVLEVPTGAAIDLSPAGMHVMLTGLNRQLVQGDHFSLFLQFERAGERQVDVVVAGMGAMEPEAAPDAGHEHMHH